MLTFTFTFSILLHAEEIDAYKIYDIKTKMNAITYKATIYEPKDYIKALVIVSPTITGIKSLELANAQYFSRHGYLAIIPHPFYTELNSPTPNVKKLDADYFLVVSVVKALIVAIEQRLDLASTTPLFIVGASQGAITAMILTAHYPRIKAAWMSVGGGDLPYIYAYSKNEAVTMFRNNHMKTLRMNNQTRYERYLRENLTNDPTISCKDIRVPFHQTIALRDDIVPTKTQELLVDECPSHDVLRVNLDHRSGTLTNVLMQKKIKDFFESSI